MFEQIIELTEAEQAKIDAFDKAVYDRIAMSPSTATIDECVECIKQIDTPFMTDHMRLSRVTQILRSALRAGVI